MHLVERPCQDQVVVGRDLLGRWIRRRGELSVVDQSAGLVDDEQRVDCPANDGEVRWTRI